MSQYSETSLYSYEFLENLQSLGIKLYRTYIIITISNYYLTKGLSNYPLLNMN